MPRSRSVSPSLLLLTPARGIIYVANSGNNTIEKFTPGGVGSVFANSGLNSPTFLAITNDSGVPLRLANGYPTPEPGTFSLLAGSSLLLAARRRRSA